MRICSANGNGWACERTSDRHPFTKGMCRTHYTQLHQGRALSRISYVTATNRSCSFDNCQRAVSAKGLCTGHYQQQSAGRPLTPLRRKRDSATYQAMVRNGIIECLGCGESKPTSEYSAVNRSGAPRPYCKPCNAERVRLSNYNVTKEFIERLWRYQGERCAICESPGTGSRAPHIDHDHTCCNGGRSCGACVRGLVCSNCNAYALAWYEALPAHLRTFDLLNDYLARPPAKRLQEKPLAEGGA
ncbi:endonuclease domain-containing protein [Streptomyces sp. NPDC059900]|uniref:endonuclease domain-containing protein n=1 Tax=Streptomyces sp. NPDC059900 TaxID=3155816 RepID=UPI003429A0ED